ncbi:MAG: flavodoxin family protein [Oscillospiraceae bacterium]|jgi:putative NADPH-quinone reductase
MKILGISGGSKNGSNDAMCREALIGAKEKGAEIEFIRLLDLNLKPCTGCISCVNGMMRGGNGDCVIKDDFKWLEDKVLDADGIVWAMPIFEKGAPGVMHLVQDRLFGPAHDPGMAIVSGEISKQTGGPGPDIRKMRPKPMSFISIGGSDWNTRVSCDMNMLSMAAGWKTIDDLVFPWSKSIILDDEAVEKCHQVGVNIVNAASDFEHAKYLGDPGCCSNCHSRNFFLGADGKAVCEVCGIIGDIVLENGKYSFVFPEEQLRHAHNLIPGKMLHMQDIGKYEGQLAEQKKTPEFKARVQKYKDFITASRPSAEVIG